MIAKKEENIVRGNSYYTLIQILATDRGHGTPSEFINEIIGSNHHFWQGDKFPEGMTWTFSDKNGSDVAYHIVKTFGFYDNEQIRPSNYKNIDFDQFELTLTKFIFQETEDKEYETKIRELVQEYRHRPLSVFQFMADKLEVSKFSVYSYFIAFILLDIESKESIRIEFGQD